MSNAYPLALMRSKTLQPNPFPVCSARILIVTRVKSGLEDDLDDEAIGDPFRSMVILNAIVRRADDPLSHSRRLFGTDPEPSESSDKPLPSRPSTPRESDPTKADPHDLDEEKTHSPQIPGKEQGGERA